MTQIYRCLRFYSGHCGEARQLAIPGTAVGLATGPGPKTELNGNPS